MGDLLTTAENAEFFSAYLADFVSKIKKLEASFGGFGGLAFLYFPNLLANAFRRYMDRGLALPG